MQQVPCTPLISSLVPPKPKFIPERGSGSTPNDLTVIADEKPVQADKVHMVRFGKGERFADQTSKALSEGVVEALNMSR